MGRIKKNDEATTARFALGTLEAIDARLEPKESRRDFIQTAVERELKRRDRLAKQQAGDLDPHSSK